MPEVTGQDEKFWYWNDDGGTPWITVRTPEIDETMSAISNLSDSAPPNPIPEPLPTPNVPRFTPPVPIQDRPRTFLENVGYQYGRILPPEEPPSIPWGKVGAGIKKVGADLKKGYQKSTGDFREPSITPPTEDLETETGTQDFQSKPFLPDETGVSAPSPIEQTFSKYEGAIGQRQKVVKDLGDIQADILEEQAGLQQQALNEVQEQFKKDQEERERWNKVIDRDIEEIQNINIDPNRLWNSRGTGQKVMATIGLMLGSIGSGYNRTGRNSAMELFQNSIERDIESQEQNINKKSNLMRFNFERYKNMDAARSATRLQQYTYAQKQAEIFGMKSRSPLVKKMAEDTIAQLEENKQSSKLEFLISMSKGAASSLSDIPWERIPKGEHPIIRGELKKLGTLKGTITTLNRIYGEAFHDVGLVSKLNPFGVDRAQFDANNAAIIRQAYADQGRQLSDEELNRTIGKYTLNNFDLLNKARIRAKQKAFMSEIIEKLSSTPRLDHYGFDKSGYFSAPINQELDEESVQRRESR